MRTRSGASFFAEMGRYLHKAMDTEFTLAADGVDETLAASAARACFDRIDALELLLTKFNDTSDVAMIRALKPGAVATVSREIVDLLIVAAHVCEATAGAFDPTVERRNFSDLVIDAAHCRVAVKGRVELDFGGIGKGFALDECRKILEGEQFGLTRWAQSWAIAPTGAVADALSTAALSLTPAELQAAADALGARLLVARRQPTWMDRLRDPLMWYNAHS